MSPNQSPREVYAQSSDIRSRSYLEYRGDMKKKAIAELEILEWFEGMLGERHGVGKVKVEKSGGDRHLWFTRSARTISGEPDFTAWIDGRAHKFEFQYSERDDLPFFDFKVSKVGEKPPRRPRVPHEDREFLYIIKPIAGFAILSPRWIMKNGEERSVAAWGSRPAFRVPAEKFMSEFRRDGKLEETLRVIEKKNQLLEAQGRFLEDESVALSGELQKIVDEEKSFTIIPGTLDGFYRACFMMSGIGKYPENHSMWIVYGASLYSDDMDSREFAKLVYALDFLFGGTAALERNVLDALISVMQKCSRRIERMQEQNLQTCPDISPRKEAVNFLFAVNLYEDILQEMIHLYDVKQFASIRKIFQSVKDLDALREKTG